MAAESEIGRNEAVVLQSEREVRDSVVLRYSGRRDDRNAAHDRPST
jgi:hypothetical protein